MIYKNEILIKTLVAFFEEPEKLTLKFTWRVNFHFSGVGQGVPGSIDPDHGNNPGSLAPPQASSYSPPAPGMHKQKL